MKKNTESTTEGLTSPTVIMIIIVLYLNVMKKNTESTTRFLKKENNRNIMTYEHQICSRCTRKSFCICFDSLCYCDACFETMCNDLETKEQMKKILQNYGKN